MPAATTENTQDAVRWSHGWNWPPGQLYCVVEGRARHFTGCELQGVSLALSCEHWGLKQVGLQVRLQPRSLRGVQVPLGGSGGPMTEGHRC